MVAGIQYAVFLNCYFVTGTGCYVRISIETHEPDTSYRGPIRFIGCGNELYSSAPGGGKVKAGIILSAPQKNNPTHVGLTFDDSSFSFQTRTAVLVTDPMTLKDFRYNHRSSSGGNGGLQLHSLVNSEIKLTNGKAVIAGDARNNLLTGPAGSFQIRGADVGNVYRDTSDQSLHGHRRSVVRQTKDYRIEPYLSGAVVTNRGAEGPLIFTLPPASPGLYFTIANAAGKPLTVAAAEGDGLAIGGERRQTLASKIAASSITVVSDSDGVWIVMHQFGDWIETQSAGSKPPASEGS